MCCSQTTLNAELKISAGGWGERVVIVDVVRKLTCEVRVKSFDPDRSEKHYLSCRMTEAGTLLPLNAYRLVIADVNSITEPTIASTQRDSQRHWSCKHALDQVGITSSLDMIKETDRTQLYIFGKHKWKAPSCSQISSVLPQRP